MSVFERLSGRDLLGVGLFVGLGALLAIFALLGYPAATLALPLLVGFSAGYVVARLVTSARAPGWARVTATLSAATALTLGCLLLVSPFVNPDLLQVFANLYQGGAGTTLGRLALGFAFSYFGQVFRRFSFPALFPTTPEEANRQSRESVRGVLIVGGLFMGLVVLVAVAWGVLALIAHLVVALYG